MFEPPTSHRQLGDPETSRWRVAARGTVYIDLNPHHGQALSTWLLDHIGHTTGAILAVLKGDLSLAGALDSNG